MKARVAIVGDGHLVGWAVSKFGASSLDFSDGPAVVLVWCFDADEESNSLNELIASCRRRPVHL